MNYHRLAILLPRLVMHCYLRVTLLIQRGCQMCQAWLLACRTKGDMNYHRVVVLVLHLMTLLVRCSTKAIYAWLLVLLGT